ncbi:hypothetical protein [Peribacillus simplex]|uniref:hypothetical protein n=1 Tax=Peribacillus simplex TaxID=1478 RepID=UPI0024C1B19F|nr:hypothetical protein [Peribacillus simplex]WHY57530.1 hypothetical protein QNH43_04340 [Peribacillus simplex]
MKDNQPWEGIGKGFSGFTYVGINVVFGQFVAVNNIRDKIVIYIINNFDTSH